MKKLTKGLILFSLFASSTSFAELASNKELEVYAEKIIKQILKSHYENENLGGKEFTPDEMSKEELKSKFVLFLGNNRLDIKGLELVPGTLDVSYREDPLRIFYEYSEDLKEVYADLTSEQGELYELGCNLTVSYSKNFKGAAFKKSITLSECTLERKNNGLVKRLFTYDCDYDTDASFYFPMTKHFCNGWSYSSNDLVKTSWRTNQINPEESKVYELEKLKTK